ncbi:MAG: hypothetical protein KatS3mg002_1712 [Candidatus Woesearchaeota archaeon]|nr:MAG: hypothetical protein KatS3mg002_1712 [Candidatus Woesearchaeota archaeon]
MDIGGYWEAARSRSQWAEGRCGKAIGGLCSGIMTAVNFFYLRVMDFNVLFLGTVLFSVDYIIRDIGLRLRPLNSRERTKNLLRPSQWRF